jgi:hypothetical protein
VSGKFQKSNGRALLRVYRMTVCNFMVTKRKILVVIGIIVALVIGIYTGIFGMGEIVS